MRILMLTHAFNSLSQRLWLELTALGHDVSIELDINDATTLQAVLTWRPDLILAPFLKRGIPPAVWRKTRCLVVHPGPLGDRGPSALDWAILEDCKEWGVTVLEAVAEMDAGPVFGSRTFPMRRAAKSSLYRREVTEAATAAVLEALDRLSSGKGPMLQSNEGAHAARPVMTQADRAITWSRDGTEAVLAKIRSADGQPGVRDDICGRTVWLHDAWPGPSGIESTAGEPGAILARSEESILRKTTDGAVWIGHLKVALPHEKQTLKLPAVTALDVLAVSPPRLSIPDGAPNRVTSRAEGDVAIIDFPFLNGAMNPARCRALAAEIDKAAQGPAKAILLTGGSEFWSNGIDLATIEADQSPAEASMAAIEAMDDVCLAMLDAKGKWVVSALQGNAGAGGVFLALAADEVIARDGVVLNPHYKNMGNLYGSEYWTYLLPRRLGEEGSRRLMASRMPLSASGAARIGLIDAVLPGEPAAFVGTVLAGLRNALMSPEHTNRMSAKAARRAADESMKPLAAYRQEELSRMRLNFYGFDTSYHVARHDFILRTPHSRTPLHLARHRH